MDPHPAELGALGLQCLGAHRGQEAGEVPTSRRSRLPCSEGEPEKGEAGVLMLAPTLAVLVIDDPCLVGMEPQPNLIHPLSDPGQHRLRLCPAFAVHDDIISEALKRATRNLPGHPRIKRVVQEQVRQARRDRRPLRGSSAALLKGPVGMLQRRVQPPFHAEQHPAAVGDRLDRPDDQVPRHLIEELLDVQIDRPVELPAPLPAYRNRIMRRASRPIAIGILMKPRFHQRLQEHGHGRLRDPVCDRRHPKQTDPIAVRLGDLDRPDRRWKPGPRTHPVPDLVEVALQIGLELVDILPIHAGGALVGLDLPPRLPHQLLGNRKRLTFRLWHISSRFLPGLSPRLIDWTSLMSRPLRSTPTPASRRFSATTSRSASKRRDRYSMPPVSAVGTLPLAARQTDPQARTAAFDARLLTFHARAADQVHAASPPDTTWPT